MSKECDLNGKKLYSIYKTDDVKRVHEPKILKNLKENHRWYVIDEKRR